MNTTYSTSLSGPNSRAGHPARARLFVALMLALGPALAGAESPLPALPLGPFADLGPSTGRTSILLDPTPEELAALSQAASAAVVSDVLPDDVPDASLALLGPDRPVVQVAALTIGRDWLVAAASAARPVSASTPAAVAKPDPAVKPDPVTKPAPAAKPAAAVAPVSAPTVSEPQESPAADLKLMSDLLKLPPVLAIAQDSPAMSLLDAARMGLKDNPEAEAARWRVKSFEAVSRAARGALLPKLELRIARGVGRADSSGTVESLPRQDISAVMTQPVFDEPARQEWGRQKHLVGSAKAQRDGTESQAVLDTGLAWLSVMQSRVGIELSQEYTALLAELERYIGERVAGGGASPAERERVTARVANVRAGLIDNQAALQAALRNFRRLTDVTPLALNLDEVPLLNVPSKVEAAQDEARAQNAEIRVASAEREAAETERMARRGAFLPRVSVELSHTRNLNSAGTATRSTDSKGQVVMTLSLLNGGSDRAQMEAAEARGKELAAKADAVRRRVIQDLDTAYTNLAASRERLVAVRSELVANRKVVEAFRAQLTGGNRPLLDVLDAYQRLHQSRLDLLQLVVNTTQTEWRVAHLTGRLQSLALR